MGLLTSSCQLHMRDGTSQELALVPADAAAMGAEAPQPAATGHAATIEKVCWGVGHVDEDNAPLG
jgi:hypothetical protein